MWFDRTMLRVSLVAGSVAGAIVLAKLILVPRETERPRIEAPPVSCETWKNATNNYRDLGGGDEAAQLTFLEGSLLRRFGRLDDALPLFLDILDHHRDLEIAEYAANLALDTYNRLDRHAEKVELARRLAKDRKFLADKPALADLVARIDRIARGPHAGEHYQP